MLVKNIRMPWITVSDLHAAKKFYVEVMGCKVHKEIPQAQWLEVQCGDQLLGIYQPFPGDYHKPGQNAVVAFNVQNIEAVKKTLESQGMRFLKDDPGVPGVFKMMTYVDKDNNTFQLYERLIPE